MDAEGVEDFFRRARERFSDRDRRERIGQAMYNQLVVERPDLARAVCAGPLDPFYDNRNCEAFMEWVRENW